MEVGGEVTSRDIIYGRPLAATNIAVENRIDNKAEKLYEL
jgi:hypothetical protein